MRQRGMRNLLPGVIAVLFVGVPLSLVYLIPDAQAAIRTFLTTLPPQTVNIIMVVVANVGVFFLALMGVQTYREIAMGAVNLPNSQIVVLNGTHPLRMEATSVCDQVYLAVSKIPGVQVIEVITDGRTGRAHIEIRAQVETPNLLTPKAEVIRETIKTLAAECLHIELADEPVLIMSTRPVKARTSLLPPHRGLFGSSSTSGGGLFGRFLSGLEARERYDLPKPTEKPPKLPKPHKPTEKPTDRPTSSLFGFRKPEDTPFTPYPFASGFPNVGSTGGFPPADDAPPSAFKDFLNDLFSGEADDDPDDKPNTSELPF